MAQGKEELLDLLRSWLRDSSAATIGNLGRFGGRAWVHARIDGLDVVLNADTKRHAVANVVELAREFRSAMAGGGQPPGNVNAVLPGTEEPVPGWYCYTTKPLDQPRDLT